jgi:hypothetical protein
MDAVRLSRPSLIRQGRRLEYFTIVWNSLEAIASIVARLFAGSISLPGFGLDSAIEVASGKALLWRLHHDLDPSRLNLASVPAYDSSGVLYCPGALHRL